MKNENDLKDESGFTLMELIVVIGIIIILIALLVPRFSGMTDKANAVAAQNDARIALTALSAYSTSVDTLPGTRYSDIKAQTEINKALGDETGEFPPAGTHVATGAVDRTAVLTSKRGALTYVVTIDARKGKITDVDCTGDKGACESLLNAGLVTTAPTK